MNDLWSLDTDSMTWSQLQPRGTPPSPRYIYIAQSSLMSVRLSVCMQLKISVTAELIGFYSSGNIPTGPVVVLGYFLGGGWD